MVNWRAAGVDSSRLELWVVGLPGSADETIATFVSDSDASCFIDGEGGADVTGAYKAEVDYFYIIGADGTVEAIGNVQNGPLGEAANRQALQSAIDSLLI